MIDMIKNLNEELYTMSFVFCLIISVIYSLIISLQEKENHITYKIAKNKKIVMWILVIGMTPMAIFSIFSGELFWLILIILILLIASPIYMEGKKDLRLLDKKYSKENSPEFTPKKDRYL